MPSRAVRDILVHILENSSVGFHQEEPLRVSEGNGFHTFYMGHFNPEIILR